MRTEEDIREAFRELAREAPDVDSILAGLPERPGGSASRSRRQARRRLAPVAASVAIVAVIAASVAIAGGFDRGGGVTRSILAPGTEAPGRGVPQYYVAIMQPSGSGIVTTIRDTRSGAVLTTVNPPAGYQFNDAVASPGDDWFVLAAQPVAPPLDDPERLYVLRFNPATLDTSLTELPVPAIPDPDGLAISPGGNELAVASAGPSGSALRIYARSGRLIRQWQDPGGICPGQTAAPCPSWSASGYLAFDWVNYNATMYGGRATTAPVTGPAANGVRLIRATAPSGSLVSASRLAVPFKIPDYINFILSGDGKTVAGDFLYRPHRGYQRDVYEEFSAATGKLTGQRYLSDTGALGGVFWSNRTGSTLVIRVPPSLRPSSRDTVWSLGILARGRFTPLPTPAGPWIAYAF